jgi:hypothetical protein
LLHRRILAIDACEAVIHQQEKSARPASAESASAPAGRDPQHVQQTENTAQTKASLSYIAHGAKAWLVLKPGSRPHRALQRMIQSMARFVLSRRRLASVARALVARSPRLGERLRSAVNVRSTERLVSTTTQHAGVAENVPREFSPPDDFSDLSSEARDIARNLQSLLRKN